MESTTEPLHTARKRFRKEPHLGKHRDILKTLEDFKTHEFEVFKWHLSRNVMTEFEAIPKSYLENKNRSETVEVMVDFHTGDTAVKVTVGILKKLSQHNAAQLLMEKYLSVNHENAMLSTRGLLLSSLNELRREDFESFQQQLSQKVVIIFEAIPTCRLENRSRVQTVDLMVGAHTEDGAVSVALEILKLMGRRNSAVKLFKSIFERESGYRSCFEGTYRNLVEVFNNLKIESFGLFTQELSQPTIIGFEAIPRGLLENKSREEIVDLMVEYHTADGAVIVMVEILKRIGQRNAAMMLEKQYRALSQPDGTVSVNFISWPCGNQMTIG